MAGQLMLVNPKRRKKRRKTRVKRRRNPVAANPRRRKRRYVAKRRYRRNPARRGGFKITGIIRNTLAPAAMAAGGAIGLDLIMGYLPIPIAMKTGPMRHVIKGAAAIGMGMLAANFVSKQTAETFTSGALTVVMYNAGREMAARFAPNIQLGEYMNNDNSLGYYGAGYDPGEMAALDLESSDYLDYDDSGMGATIYEEDELSL